MSVVNFYLSGDQEHDRVIRAFYEGCPESNERNILSVQDYQPSDIAVVFGVRKKAVPFSQHRGRVFDEQEAASKTTVVLETGYLKRGSGEDDYYAAGIGGLNGRAWFRNHRCKPDRWEKLGIELRPWRTAGVHIVLCGQVPWDASVDFTDHVAWLKAAVGRIRYHTQRPIVFRPHPKAKIPPIAGCEYSTKPLADDLVNAWAVVTFNSNAGVDAAVAGIPVFVDDVGSMASGVANKNLVYLEDPGTPEREQWAYNLAFCQWTPAEMRESMAWAHLFPS